MAKSIEQKTADVIADMLSDYRFRHYEFSRIMLEQPPYIHKQFFVLITSYLNYLAAYERHGWYPNGSQEESEVAAQVVDIINTLITP